MSAAPAVTAYEIATGNFDAAIDELATGYYADAAAALTKALSHWKVEV